MLYLISRKILWGSYSYGNIFSEHQFKLTHIYVGKKTHMSSNYCELKKFYDIWESMDKAFEVPNKCKETFFGGRSIYILKIVQGKVFLPLVGKYLGKCYFIIKLF